MVMNATNFVIDVQGITKRFGNRTVVNNIPMQVRRGEIYGFLAPTAAAKRRSCGCCAACLGPTVAAGAVWDSISAQ